MNTNSENASTFNSRDIIGRALDGMPPTADEAAHLLQATDETDLRRLREAAEEIRRRQVGDAVLYANRMSLFLTNLDELQPSVYGYSRKPGAKGAFVLSVDDLDACLETLSDTPVPAELFIGSGGYWPLLRIPGLESPSLLKTYARLLAYIQDKKPGLPISGFSPDEVDFLSIISGRGHRYILELLKDQGLKTLGGHGAGVLVDSVRQKISPKRATVKRWLAIAATTHQLQLPMVLNLEAGHFETLAQRIAHLNRTRDFLVRHPGAFCRLEPLLPPARDNAPEDWAGARFSRTDDRRKLLAVARLFLGDVLPHQQVFWNSVEEAQEGLAWGANVLGGADAFAWPAFLVGSRDAERLKPLELERLIRDAGRTPETLTKSREGQ